MGVLQCLDLDVRKSFSDAIHSLNKSNWSRACQRLTSLLNRQSVYPCRKTYFNQPKDEVLNFNTHIGCQIVQNFVISIEASTGIISKHSFHQTALLDVFIIDQSCILQVQRKPLSYR